MKSGDRGGGRPHFERWQPQRRDFRTLASGRDRRAQTRNPSGEAGSIPVPHISQDVSSRKGARRFSRRQQAIVVKETFKIQTRELNWQPSERLEPKTHLANDKNNNKGNQKKPGSTGCDLHRNTGSYIQSESCAHPGDYHNINIWSIMKGFTCGESEGLGKALL